MLQPTWRLQGSCAFHSRDAAQCLVQTFAGRAALALTCERHASGIFRHASCGEQGSAKSLGDLGPREAEAFIWFSAGPLIWRVRDVQSGGYPRTCCCHTVTLVQLHVVLCNFVTWLRWASLLALLVALLRSRLELQCALSGIADRVLGRSVRKDFLEEGGASRDRAKFSEFQEVLPPWLLEGLKRQSFQETLADTFGRLLVGLDLSV